MKVLFFLFKLLKVFAYVFEMFGRCLRVSVVFFQQQKTNKHFGVLFLIDLTGAKAVLFLMTYIQHWHDWMCSNISELEDD